MAYATSIFISQRVCDKLAEKHNVTPSEVEECLMNRERTFLEDNREDHKTDPATLWFISTTDQGKELKVVVIYAENRLILKSAFPPNAVEKDIYAKKSKLLT